MSNIVFSAPEFLIYLVFLPLIIILFLSLHFLRSRRLSKFLNKKILTNFNPSFSFVRKAVALGLALLSLALLILSLSHPQSLSKEVVEENEGVEIMILVDISKSMLAQDVRPSRLALLKTELHRFISLSKKHHRFGLIAFAGSSFLMSPLTSDKNIIQLYIHSLSPDIISSQGTHLKAALSQALKSLQGGSFSLATKVIIIASDGEDNEIGAFDEIKKITKEGVRIFALGFGTEEGARIPIEGTLGYLKDQSGQEVLSKFKGHLLKEYARIGQGAFYHVKPASLVPQKLHQDLMNLEQYVFEQKKKKNRNELFQYFLLPAFFLSLAHLTLRRRKQL